MDAIDRNIIAHLQKQGRMTNVELARLNDLAPSSMLERVRRLEERGIIKGYRAVLDPKSLGYTVEAIVMINLDRHQAGPIDDFEDRIRAVPEVKACWHLTGRYDYMVHLVVRDIDHLGNMVKHVLAGIMGVEKQETFLVLSTTKHDEGYSLEPMPEKTQEE
ncbi:MAG: Lrp/AsnC family transcriptional regulator [Myxococcota bacterium]|jgi:Lrp/AsnC family leucine-responsive transcriptional regulator|nr:Lrp/AsnC family transcriptional regulator [Myxococcota bacterium]